MDADIQFGDLEEAPPRIELRPDRNKHYALAAYEKPIDSDLPIFIDFDVLRDIEVHALSDTGVELGGVLLGGQFHDDDGKPFVLISDSLRAKHYESTKGSFKFTHETWSEIGRERDQFPDDLQMVGWYHTHPDWGVFLSGMDMFICDNFFNRMLDVALVVDPCRGDRGMFQWTGDSQRIRRTKGFYVVSSRFRQDELDWYVNNLEGASSMSFDPRMAGGPGGGAPSIVNVTTEKNSIQWLAILGMLSLQFCLLLLIGLRIAFPNVGQDPQKTTSSQRDELEAAKAELAQEKASLKAQQEALARVIDNMPGDTRGNLTAVLTSTLAEADDLRRSVDRSNVTIDTLDERLRVAASQLKKEKIQTGSLQKRVDAYKKTERELKDQLEEAAKQIKAKKEKDGGMEPFMQVYGWLIYTAAGALLGAVVTAGVFVFRPEEPLHDHIDAETATDDPDFQVENNEDTEKGQERADE